MWLGMDSQGDLDKLMTVTKVIHPYRNLFIKRSVQCAHGIPDTGHETDPRCTSSDAKKATHASGHFSVLLASTQDLHKPPTASRNPHGKLAYMYRVLPSVAPPS